MPIQFRRGQESELTPADLLSGEPAFTTDTHKLFIGDGEDMRQLAMSADLTAHDTSASAHTTRFNAKLDKAGGTVSGNLAVAGNLLVGANGGSSVWTAGSLPVESGKWEPILSVRSGSPSGATMTYTVTNNLGCWCYRIGDMVYITATLRLSVTASGNESNTTARPYAEITNLPFAPATGQRYNVCFCDCYSILGGSVPSSGAVGYIEPEINAINIQQADGAPSAWWKGGSNILGGLSFSAWYKKA